MFRFGDPGGRMYTSVGTSSVNILAHWTTAPTQWSVSAGNGRIGGSSLRLTDANGNVALVKTLDSQQTWGIALGLKLSVVTGASCVLFGLQDAGTAQVDVRINSDATLSITRNGTVLGTSSVTLSTSAYAHLELKVKVDPSVGTVELRRNGVAIIGPLTGQNTRNTANSTANQVILGHIAGQLTGTWDVDDFIVWDAQTTDANGFTDISNFIGDCGLVWLLPSGAGTTTQFTPDTGSNFARVNEATPDGDTSYVEDSTVGHIDTYAMANLGGTVSTIKSVAAVSYSRKTDVGSRGMKTELRSAGANAVNATEIALGNNYQYYFQNWAQDPNNGSPTNWTPTSVNAVEAGQIVSS